MPRLKFLMEACSRITVASAVGADTSNYSWFGRVPQTRDHDELGSALLAFENGKFPLQLIVSCEASMFVR